MLSCLFGTACRKVPSTTAVLGHHLGGMMVQRSIRRVWGHKPTDEEVIPVDNLPLTQEGYRGFGSVRGESLDEFHERMFDLDPLEAMMYELEVALEQSHDHPPYPTE